MSETATTQSTEVRIRKRDLRQLKTAWLECGNPSGPILLFLHGFPDSPHSWNHQLEYFKKDFFVICPFVRGASQSSAGNSTDRYSTKAEALDVLQILETVEKSKDRPIFVVGHDLGGAVAWAVAPLLGKRLKGLISVNSLSLPQMRSRLLRRPGQWLKSWYFAPMLLPYFPEFAFSHFGGTILNFIQKTGSFPPIQDKPSEYCREYVVGPLHQYRAFALEMFESAFEKPTKLAAPTLVLWSNQDNYLLHPKLDEIEPYAEKPEVRILDGKHWIHVDSPELFNRVLEEFFQRCLK